MTQPTRATPARWTYAEYARLPADGNRYEVLDGEILVTPAPSPHHQKVILRLAIRLIEYVESGESGWVLQDVDLLFQTGQYLRPDLLVVPSDGRSGITDRGVEGVPALVVEVSSPSSGTVDRVKKPRRYLDFGVPAYWVVDPVEEAVHVWTADTGPDAPRRVEDTLRWAFPKGTEPIEIDVPGAVAPL